MFDLKVKAAAVAPKKRKSIFLVSSSAKCKPNSVMSSRVLQYFERQDYPVAENIKDADMVVVNTCACTQELEHKTIDLFRTVYREKPGQAQVVSVGCLNAINRKALEDRFPGLHIVQHLSELSALADSSVLFSENTACYYDKHLMDYASCDKHFSLPERGVIRGAELLCRLSEAVRYPDAQAAHLPQILDEIHQTRKVCVQISSGCKGQCSYCIIKKAKGDLRSRKIHNILDDIAEMRQKGMLADNTVVNLVADDCACYGLDIGETLLGLVAAIHSRFAGVPLEFCYVHPAFIVRERNAYVEMFKNVSINSINIPLQSGSDRIVHQMNRDYAVADVLDVVDEIEHVSPRTLIWSHFIVGFPSETWKDFMRSLRAARRFHFYVPSIYSARAGTPAAGREGQVAPAQAKARYYLFIQQLLFQKMCGLLLPARKKNRPTRWAPQGRNSRP